MRVFHIEYYDTLYGVNCELSSLVVRLLIMEVIMLYQFTYQLNGIHFNKVCHTIREAEVFFAILISAKCEYLRVITYTRRHPYDKK